MNIFAPRRTPLHFITFLLSLSSCVSLEASSPLPHIVYILVDDFGYGNVGYHRNGSSDPAFKEVVTPAIDSLAATGIILSRHYAFQYCSPTRSALQTGRNPVYVNVLNSDPLQHNPNDPISGFAAVPRNMTGLAAKLKMAGYKTHMAGKWHIGMATTDHIPVGRGYDTSLGYFAAANDYWDETPDASVAHCPGIGAMTDLWLTSGPAHGLNNSRECSQSNQSSGCVYEDDLFRESILKTIAAHDPATPLFAFIAWHNCHVPLQVPQAYVDKFAFINNSDRALYAAKANYMDDNTGAVIDALRAAGLYNNSIIVLTSDNGGPLANANNFPLSKSAVAAACSRPRVTHYSTINTCTPPRPESPPPPCRGR